MHFLRALLKRKKEMNIKFKDKLNIYPGTKMKPQQEFSFASLEKPQLNKHDNRSLSANYQNLSFKGLSSVKLSHAIKEFGKEFGTSAEMHFKERLMKAASVKNSGLAIDGESVTFMARPFVKRLFDVITYPITKMPLDLVNSTVYGIKRLFKNPHALDNISNIRVLKNRRESLESLSDVAAIERYFGMVEKGEKGFTEAQARFNPLVSNYNSVTEKVLTRIVTGLIPAFFLANDAHNLSIYMNNNKDLAETEKKRRFNQEVARIGITAASTFAVLSLFAKRTNGSESMTVVLMSALTLASEIIGRKLAGTPVMPLDKKGAKKYAELQGKEQSESETKIPQETNFSSKEKSLSKVPEKGKITFKNIMKVVGLLVLAGFGVEKASNIKSVKKLFGNLNEKYINLYTKDFNISRDEFSQITKKLRENGFDKLAEKYESIVKTQKGDILNLGRTHDKVKYTLIHHILTFPVRFTWDTLMLPYKQVVKPLFAIGKKGVNKITKNESQKSIINPEEQVKKEMEILRNSIRFLKKIEKNSDYQTKVNDSILASLDNVTKSSYSSAGLASTVRVVMNTITSAFLIADNYNLVMIDSRGNDKDLAEQKAKERALQRAVKIIYGAFAVKLFNGVFGNVYNASLLGAQSVNAVNTFITENIERTTVGMPVHEASREEIVQKEQENLRAEGFKGDYFRFMAMLTGKKQISKIETKEKK